MTELTGYKIGSKLQASEHESLGAWSRGEEFTKTNTGPHNACYYSSAITGYTFVRNYDPETERRLFDLLWEPEIANSPTIDVPKNLPIDYELKSWTYLFRELIAGRKTADMRDKRDREYKVGQRVLLREFDHTNGTYTGRWAHCMITHIISNDTPCAMSSAALDRNFCILSLRVGMTSEEDMHA